MWQRNLLILLVTIGFIGYLFYVEHEDHQHPPSALMNQTAPDFELTSDQGQTVRLSELRGKVVLVHFWATWCFPCVKEIPELEKFVAQFSPEQFQLVAVSLDDSLDEVLKFQKRVPFKFPFYVDETKRVADLYGTYMLPETYIIDKQGRVVEKAVGAQYWGEEQWADKVNQLMSRD